VNAHPPEPVKTVPNALLDNIFKSGRGKIHKILTLGDLAKFGMISSLYKTAINPAWRRKTWKTNQASENLIRRI
jgi:hypothetical protein